MARQRPSKPPKSSKSSKSQRRPRPETLRPPPETPQRPQRYEVPRSPRNANKYRMDSTPQIVIESNKSPLQIVSMERGLPTAPQKDFWGPFQYLGKSAIATDASTFKPNPLKFGILYGSDRFDWLDAVPIPRTLTQRLEFSRANRDGNKASEFSFVTPRAAGISTRTPSVLHRLTVEIRIIIYDAYFKGTKHERKAPALVIAMRGDPHLYSEVIERYYHGCSFTLSQYNLRRFEEHFPLRFMSIIRNLTVEDGITLPTQNSIHHKYKSRYMKTTRPIHDIPEEPEIPLTRWTNRWLDAQKHQVEDIYGEVWEDFQGLTEQLLSFSSLWKVQQAQNLRDLHLRTRVNYKTHLCQLVKGVYEFFPRLERMLLEDYHVYPDEETVYALRAEFVIGDAANERKLKYIDNETHSRIVGELFYPACIPVGFRIWRDPKTGLKRHFLMKIGLKWSGNETLGSYSD